MSDIFRWEGWNDENWLDESEIGFEHYFETEPSFSCLINHLRTVRISRARISNCSLHLVEFLLENAVVLDRMEIVLIRNFNVYSSTSFAELLKLSNLLSTCRKASPSTIIVLA